MEKNKEALWSAGTWFVEVGRVAGVVIGEPRSGGRQGSSWSPATVVSIKKKPAVHIFHSHSFQE